MHDQGGLGVALWLRPRGVVPLALPEALVLRLERRADGGELAEQVPPRRVLRTDAVALPRIFIGAAWGHRGEPRVLGPTARHRGGPAGSAWRELAKDCESTRRSWRTTRRTCSNRLSCVGDRLPHKIRTLRCAMIPPLQLPFRTWGSQISDTCFGQVWSNPGPNIMEIGRCRPKFGRHRPDLAELCPNSVEIDGCGRSRPECGRNPLTWAKFGPKYG